MYTLLRSVHEEVHSS